MSKNILSSGAFSALKLNGPVNFSELTFKSLLMQGNILEINVSNLLEITTPLTLIQNPNPQLIIETPNIELKPTYPEDTLLALRKNIMPLDNCLVYLTSGPEGYSDIVFTEDQTEFSNIRHTGTTHELSVNGTGNVFINSIEASVELSMGTEQRLSLQQTPTDIFNTPIIESVTDNKASMKFISPNSLTTLRNLTNRVFVPLYVYPDGALGVYDQVGDAMLQVEGQVDVVINPNNGNDSLLPPNADWVRDLNSMQTNAGAYWSTQNVWGYTYTLFGTRDLQEVYDVIDGYMTQGWQQWVGGGFFIDEVSDDVDYYQSIADYVNTNYPNTSIILNPGVNVSLGLSQISGVSAIVTYEDIFSNFTRNVNTYQLLDHVINKYICIANSAPTVDDVIPIIDKQRTKNFGRFYITDAANYNTLSAYFTDILDYLSIQ